MTTDLDRAIAAASPPPSGAPIHDQAAQLVVELTGGRQGLIKIPLAATDEDLLRMHRGITEVWAAIADARKGPASQIVRATLVPPPDAGRRQR